MNKTETKKLAREMTAFCKERVKARKKRSSPLPKVILNTVIATILAAPAATGGPNKKSSW